MKITLKGTLQSLILAIVILQLLAIIIFIILPFDFIDHNHGENSFFVFYVADITLPLLLFFYTLSKSQKVFATVALFIFACISSVFIASIGGYIYFFSFIGQWQSGQILYINKSNPDTVIRESVLDTGAYSSDGLPSIVQESEYGLIISRKLIDTNEIDKTEWIRVASLELKYSNPD